jgi:serine/threonine protein kinase
LPSKPPQLSGFTYVRPLGGGGFADVFLFDQNMPRRKTAVKVLLDGFVDDSVRRMFRAEADIMAELGAHPSILTVYEAGLSADGRPYIVMEFCPEGLGKSWRKRPMAVADVLHIGVKLASALETAHRHRFTILHRDIKPSNILITEYGSPVLSDFGIATSLSSDSANDILAMSVPWSAPEVISEKTSGTVASEVWSLGATLYSLLAGRSPFEIADSSKNSRDQLKSRIQKANYTPIGRSDIPESVERVLLKSMAKDPSDRYPSMLEFALELNELQSELGLRTTPLELTASSTWEAAPSAPAAAAEVTDESAADLFGHQSEVAVESKRRSRQPVSPDRASADEAPTKAPKVRGAKKKISPLMWIVGGAVILGFAIAMTVLAVAGVL